jgi:hypothetical protein
VAKTLSDIRFVVERETGELTDDVVINWCNDLNMDIGSVMNVPSEIPYEITITTTDLDYALPADLKEINRLWMQSDYDSGVDRELRVKYRIYNGRIQFPVPFGSSDTLNVDYYKFLKFFELISDSIDFADRYMTVYTSYCKMRYFMLPSTQTALGEATARRNYERAAGSYQLARNQVIQNYSFNNPDLVVRERW